MHGKIMEYEKTWIMNQGKTMEFVIQIISDIIWRNHQ